MTRSAPEELVASVGDGGEDLSLYLERLRTLMKPWAGAPIDRDGRVRILNPEGSKPPLIWCFNSQKEFPVMAAGLGPDQPVLGMRSLNAAAPPGPERQALGFRLAGHYARILLEAPGLGRCAVGGNCQSASIATRVAAILGEAGRRVDLLLTLEAVPPMPYPGRVALLFGAQSQGHNPFLQVPSSQARRPQDLWGAIFREVGWTIVPGQHGQFFTEANAGALCAGIADALADASRAQPPRGTAQGRLVLAARPTRAPAGGTLDLAAAVMGSDVDGAPFLVHALWRSDTHGFWASPAEPLLRVEAGRPAVLRVATPEQPGPWRLVLFLCRTGMGPVAWREDLDQGLDIELAGDRSATGGPAPAELQPAA